MGDQRKQRGDHDDIESLDEGEYLLVRRNARLIGQKNRQNGGSNSRKARSVSDPDVANKVRAARRTAISRASSSSSDASHMLAAASRETEIACRATGRTREVKGDEENRNRSGCDCDSYHH